MLNFSQITFRFSIHILKGISNIKFTLNFYKHIKIYKLLRTKMDGCEQKYNIKFHYCQVSNRSSGDFILFQQIFQLMSKLINIILFINFTHFEPLNDFLSTLLLRPLVYCILRKIQSPITKNPHFYQTPKSKHTMQHKIYILQYRVNQLICILIFLKTKIMKVKKPSVRMKNM